ncbi:7TM domain sensor diguanylate cyclase [Clostridium sp. DL-VIII]|uniref:sensor domain-containing diguanylate cyclase n=1 Tax=Clostridium sp. DL-VIII TaxID=641107 RepID=UPI00023B024E|nr:diguanylate cyclase [Clostridium sp. DL-VIII]EHJ01170.1 7TM domain sensor diguanylate cyclase [Clostridium sp. DL-VIII]
MKKIMNIIVLIALIVGIYSFFHMRKVKNLQAINGNMYLDKYDFAGQGIIDLDGQWEIYNNELLTPEDLKNRKPDQYLTIPGNLKEQLGENNAGYMTLKLEIEVPKDVIYGFRIKRLLSASKLWVNGIVQGEVGKVGKSYEDEKAIYLPIYSYFMPEDGHIEIVIQTSDYREVFPTIQSMELGLKDQIINESLIASGIDFIIFGGLLVIELIFISLYKRMPNKKSYLFFVILCLFIQLRCLFLNERIIVHFFPNMPFELLSKTAALTYYLWIPVYVFFIKDVFTNMNRRTVMISSMFSIIFGGICLFTNNTFYDKLSVPGEIIVIIIAADIFAFLIKKVKEKEQNSIISLIAFGGLIITGVNDMLVNNGLPYVGRYLFQIGMFIFVLLETYSLTLNYTYQVNKTKILKEKNKEIYEKSIRDGLTNLYNRYYIDKILDDMIDEYIESGAIFTIMMIDVDFFKHINDTYGHLCGDKVLMDISSFLMDNLRKTDFIGRYGGEEFIIIFPHTRIQEANKIAENIRISIEALQVDEHIKVTISGGLYENNTKVKQLAIQNVDKLLYLAKEKGRNRIEVMEEEEEESRE